MRSRSSTAWSHYAHRVCHYLCSLRAANAGAQNLTLGKSGRFLERLDSFEYLVDMAGHLEPAPLGLENAVRTDQEGAAFDALDLLAVHDLVLDHAEHVAHLFFGVRDQFERELEFGLEFVMRLHVVARHAEYGS